jgi:DNA primase
MRITEDQIEQVRNASNIVDVVGEYVQLRKRGRNFLGLCPFHKEKTPSFNVQEDKGIFKCFGCGKGGDVFRFIMEIEKLSFPESIERLAKRANITLENESTADELQEQSERESIYVAAHAAYVWFFKQLRSPSGDAALKYITQRGFTQETLRKFGVGFAPSEGGEFIRPLVAEGISEDALERAGLIAKGNSGEPYERFRGRLIFPILSPTGRVVGFGGRVMPDISTNAPQAKYVNSPETVIYHKSRVLYGLFQAKDAIRKAEKAYLVEGYLDVLSCAQAGVENIVAASGTSLTIEQLEILKRYAKSVVLLFDADQAGKNAALRGIELALEAGFDVNTVILPQGEDPDSFIKNKGAQAFKEALKAEQSFIETKAQLFAEQGMLDDPARQSRAIRSIVESIAKIPDRIKQELFLRRLATRFHILESTLLGELQVVLKKTARAAVRRAESSHDVARDEEHGDTYHSPDERDEMNHSQPIPNAEHVLLRAALLEPRLTRMVVERTNFDLALVTHPIVNHLLGHIFELVVKGEFPDVSSLSAEFRNNEPVQRVLVDSALENNQASAQWARKGAGVELATLMAEQAVIQILQTDITNRMNAVRGELDRTTDEARILELSRESLSLAQRRETLRTSFSSYAETA